MPKDLVCGREVEAREMNNIIESKGQVHYFCSEGCRIEFKDNPEIYDFFRECFNWMEKNGKIKE